MAVGATQPTEKREGSGQGAGSESHWCWCRCCCCKKTCRMGGLELQMSVFRSLLDKVISHTPRILDSLTENWE